MRRPRADKTGLPPELISASAGDPDDKLARGSSQRFGLYGLMFLGGIGLMWLIGNGMAPKPEQLDAAPPLDAPHPGGTSVDSTARHDDAATSAPVNVQPQGGSPDGSDIVHEDAPAKAPANQQQYGVYSSGKKKDKDLDAVLEELLALHRQDEIEREPPTVPPADLPVFNSESVLVVTMADGGYAACAVRLLESVRGAGRYAGALAVLVPTGDGTVPLPAAEEAKLEKDLGAALVYVPPEVFGGSEVHGAGSAVQYGKIKLLVDESFRRYSSILFLDADGVVGAPLQPLLESTLPTGFSVAMPTWPSASMEHESFYTREVNLRALNDKAVSELRIASPDRTLVGITAWFLLRPALLPSPEQMRLEVDDALRRWRPSFRFNDQGLFNVIFYNTSAFFPSCISGPEPQKRSSGPTAVRGADATADSAFKPFIVENLESLARTIELTCGPKRFPRRPMYYHGLKDCVPQAEWDRKVELARKNPGHDQQDLMEAYDRGQRRLGHRNKRF